jgi:hypothetical protein
MDKVANLKANERRELFSETAARMNLLPALVEKDFWVCWTLKHLFSIPAFESHLLFKGGTTLSKIFGVIERFSEDIDLAVDWKMLGFVGDRSPLAEMSKSKRTKLLDEMLLSCQKYIAGELVPTLRSRFVDVLGDNDNWSLAVDPDDGHVVNLTYPTSADAVQYVRPEVRLELGTHAELIPNDRYVITPYAADHFPDIFESADAPVQALKAERTFWEKATILHQEHFRTRDRDAPSRYSRHYYDVFMMADRPEVRETALGEPDLLTRVVEHKKRFYPRAWARYDLATPAGLQLLPPEDWMTFLRRDYDNMNVMLFGEPPAFDEILTGLRGLEKEIRKM